MAEELADADEWASGSQDENGHSALFKDRPTPISAMATCSGARYCPCAYSAASSSWMLLISRCPVSAYRMETEIRNRPEPIRLMMKYRMDAASV